MFAITNAEIMTVTKGTISKGTVLVDKGRIKAVGKGLRVPAKAEKIDARGRILTPGLIEAHSHAGMAEDGFYHDGDYNEVSDPVTPHLLAIDGFKPSDIGLREAAADGVTTMFVTPGSANVFCGMGAIVKTWGRTFIDYIVNPAAGLKMATGENPKRVYGSKGKAPTTRMGIGALLRETFTDARNYLERQKRHARRKKKDADPFRPDLKLEAVGRLLKGEVPARCHSHRAVDMLTFMRVADEFKFKYVFEHATEAIDILDELKRRKIPVIIGPTLGGRPKVELLHKSFDTVAAAVKAGLLVAITSDHHVLPMRFLPVYAALAVRAGLPEDEALKAITINPAKILGMDKELGSIETGKQADLVLWTGDPLDARSRPEMVFIAGQKVESKPEFRIP